MDTLASSCYLRENVDLLTQLAVLLLVDDKWSRRPLHLADIDDSICTVKQQVYLRTFRVHFIRHMSPGIRPRQHASDAQLLLDLRNMLQTHLLKRQALPCVDTRRIDRIFKAFFVSYVLISRELIPEQCVVVNKLILPSLFLFAWLIESANETALLQFLKDNLEIYSLRYLRRRSNLFARGAVWPLCQRLDDGKMYPRMTEKRREQLRILKAFGMDQADLRG